jgi:signal peptidase I
MRTRRYASRLEYFWEEWIKPILIAAALAFLIRTFIIQPFKIPTGSMEPTFIPGDRIFVSKFTYGAKIPLTDLRLPEVREPQAGDIVVFLSPVEKKKYLVKRFMAGGGETVEIRDGKVYVDGKKLEGSPFTRIFYYNRGKFGGNGETVRVPEGYFYALGDNSANSMDSRYWGFIPEENLIGKAFMIHWPVRRIRIIKEGD